MGNLPCLWGLGLSLEKSDYAVWSSRCKEWGMIMALMRAGEHFHHHQLMLHGSYWSSFYTIDEETGVIMSRVWFSRSCHCQMNFCRELNREPERVSIINELLLEKNEDRLFRWLNASNIENGSLGDFNISQPHFNFSADGELAPSIVLKSLQSVCWYLTASPSQNPANALYIYPRMLGISMLGISGAFSGQTSGAISVSQHDG